MQPYEQLEQQWADFNGLDPRGMVACSSGTAALHLALEAMRDNGKYTIVPDFTMVACARAVTLAEREPVFIDCGNDLNMDTDLLHQFGGDLKNNVHGHCSAVMAVHVYGRRCGMDEVANFGSNYGVRVVEDLAEAHGVRPHPATDAACWSFYKNKIVAGEEGGAVWFRDPKHAALARQLRSLGFTDAHDFDHVPRGHNYRMSNVHASLILGSLEYNDYVTWNNLADYTVNVRHRREIESWYDKFCPAEWRMPPRDAVWVYDLRIPLLPRDFQVTIVKALNAEGIAARLAFLPMSVQAEYRNCKLVKRSDGHKAWIASREVFYLPVQPGVTTRDDCRKAFEVIGKCLGK